MLDARLAVESGVRAGTEDDRKKSIPACFCSFLRPCPGAIDRNVTKQTFLVRGE